MRFVPSKSHEAITLLNIDQNKSKLGHWDLSHDWVFRLSASLIVIGQNQVVVKALGSLAFWNIDEPWPLGKIVSDSILEKIKGSLQEANTEIPFELPKMEFQLPEKVFHLQGHGVWQVDEKNEMGLLFILSDQTAFYEREQQFQQYVTKTEKRLQESQDVFFTFNRIENRFTYISEGMSKYSDYQAIQLEGNSELFWNQVHPEDRLYLREFLANTQAQIVSSLFRFVQQEKPLRWFQIKVLEFRELNSKVDGMFTEVTTLHKLLDSLKAQERLLNSFFLISPFYMGVLERIGNDFRILDLDPNQSAFFGVETKLLRNRMLRSVHPYPQTIDDLLPYYDQARELRTPVSYFRESPNKGEESFHCIAHYVHTNAQGNEVFTYIGIPERVMGQELFGGEGKSQLFRHVLEEVPILLWSTTREFVVQTMIGHGAEFLGLKKNELVGQNLSRVYQNCITGDSPLSAEEVMSRYNNVLMGKVEQFEFECSGRFLRCHLRPSFNKLKVIDGVIGVSLDITDFHQEVKAHRLLDQRMQESQRLESLGILAGGIAHDYNNLLTGITASMSMIQLQDEGLESIADYLHQIESSTNQMVGLTNQMLAYSGRAKSDFKILDLNEIVQNSLTMIRAVLHTNVEVELHLSQFPLRVRVDETQMYQVILNLLSNAQEAIQKNKGLIRITTRKSHVDEETIQVGHYISSSLPGDYAKLIIEDNGMGMSEELRQRIFEPFFTTKFTGRGLGLSSVQGIIKGHKGLLRVESELGKGSSFFLSLPITDEISTQITDKRNLRTMTPIPVDLKEGKVLVIDDEEMILEIAEKVLQRLGYETLIAKDGASGLRIYEENKTQIPLIILDMTMPGMNGKEVVEKLQELGYDKTLIIMSGFSEGEIRQKIRKSLPMHFLSKPFRIEDLKKILLQIQADQSHPPAV